MKKFYTLISHQGKLNAFCYKAVGNDRLDLNLAISYPILCAFAGYVEPGEDTVLVPVIVDAEPEKSNYETLKTQLAEVCRLRGLNPPEIREVRIDPSQEVTVQAASFQKLIDCAEEDDELFADMTFGTKPQSTVLMMAVQYAYRIKKNTSISRIVYGEVVRPNPKDDSTWYGLVYDMTALIRMDEIVRLLADQKVENPKAVIDAILSL